jgi:hypothetical protein
MTKNIPLPRLLSCLWVAAALASTSASAQTSVGVSIDINQPGVYGRIDIGNRPPPIVVSQQPVIIVQQPVAVVRQPIYLYVPPGHQKKWGKHCSRYNACGQPVYFVQEQWVVERYRQEHPQWQDTRYRQRDDDHEHEGHRGKKKSKGRKDD